MTIVTTVSKVMTAMTTPVGITATITFLGTLMSRNNISGVPDSAVNDIARSVYQAYRELSGFEGNVSHPEDIAFIFRTSFSLTASESYQEEEAYITFMDEYFPHAF